jgi:hypothetical protein
MPGDAQANSAPNLPLNMLGTDAFGLVSGGAGFVVITVSLCRWLSPWRRRLRALDATVEETLRLLAIIQEAHPILDRRIVLRAHQQLY